MAEKSKFERQQYVQMKCSECKQVTESVEMEPFWYKCLDCGFLRTYGFCKKCNGTVEMASMDDNAVACVVCKTPALAMIEVKMPNEKLQFTTPEWRKLQLMTLWIFREVAGANSIIEDAEIEKFLFVLESAANSQDQLLNTLLSSVVRNIHTVVAKYGEDDRNIEGALKGAALVIDSKLPDSKAREFKNAMISLAKEIASVAGVSEAEKASIIRIAKILFNQK